MGKKIHAFLIALSLLVAASAPAYADVKSLPPDVAEYLKRNDACNNLTNGAQASTPAATAEIDRQIDTLKCDQLDEDADHLRVRYKSDAAVIKHIGNASAGEDQMHD